MQVHNGQEGPLTTDRVTHLLDFTKYFITGEGGAARGQGGGGGTEIQ